MFQESFHPFLGRDVMDVLASIISLLGSGPLFGRNTFQEILPSNSILSLNGILDFQGGSWKEEKGGVSSELLDARKESPSDGWTGVGV